MKKISKNLIRSLRILFTCWIFFLFFCLTEKPSTSNKPIELYANICDDDLRRIYLNAIEKANESIYLIMYSLNDEKIIRALNHKAKKGVKVTVLHDSKTSQFGYRKLKSIDLIPIEISGLSHQKILVLDGKEVWIGSANFTTESLRLHDNLVMKFNSIELAKSILSEFSAYYFYIGDQKCELWHLPRDRKAGLNHLIDLIHQSKNSIRIAMYTWTHSKLTDAVIAAHNRGVAVEVILDNSQANGVGQRTTNKLIESGISVWVNRRQKLLHHKCLWIDENILVQGSTNWTKAAFSKNKDCFLILFDLTQEQKDKLQKMWFRTRTLAYRAKKSMT
ncbi:MAG: phosphatidylserine/phosphatidylglycerophosphate/cardiolipin synthase family protein [Chlamydiales bacterium]